MARYDTDDDFDDVLEVRCRRAGWFERPHAGAGFAALALGLFAVVGAVCAVVIIVALETAQPVPDDELWETLLGLMFLGCGTIAVAGFVLGLAGSFQSDRNPLLGILGTVVNALTILGMGVVICMGLLSEL